MNVLLGGDSATPKPAMYEGKKIWGVYVAGATFHVWSKEEVAALKAGGVEGVLPIVVPPQNEDWWLQNSGYAVLEALVREAVAWGIPMGSPLCLDVEEGQSSRFGGGASDIARSWAVACRTHDLIPWTYGSASFLDRDLWSNKWLAEWPNVTPTDPIVPEGYRGWQYRGGQDGIDLDVSHANEVFLSPELTPVTLHEPGWVEDEKTETGPETDKEPAPAPSEVVATSTPAGNDAAPQSAPPASVTGATETTPVTTVETSTVPPAPTTEELLAEISTHITAIVALLATLEAPKS